ncbi:MAG: oligosaccharide flippase family protein [Gemmatimonadaceae bacterium]
MTSGSHLDRSLARGIAWTGGVKWFTSLITWAITLLIARLLTPQEFGLFGMAMVFIGLAQLTSDVGLTATMIQAPNLTDRLTARLGGAAIMISAGIAAITVGAAGLIAVFFREPVVQWIVMALSVSFVLRGVQVMRRAMLTRALRFRQIAWVDGAESVVTSFSTLGYALLGLRHWSLVLGALTGVAVSTVALVLLYPHPVRFPRRVAELEGSLSFGAQVFGGQVAWYFYSTADMIVVGRMLGTVALGAYSFAWVIASIAVERVAALMSRVTPAIFSKVQHDHAALRRYVYRLTEGLALITMPICIGVALVADLIVNVALGKAWVAAIAPMRLLALYAAARCIVVILPQLLVYTGRARQSMQFNLVFLAVLVPLFIAGATWGGTSGVALAWAVVFPLLSGFTYLRFLRSAISLSMRSYARSLAPAAGGAAVMAAAVLTVRSALPPSLAEAWQLAILVLTGALVYGAMLLAFHRRRIEEVVGLLRGNEAAAEPVVAAPEIDPPASSRGRLLLISYHFPPDPAIGSLRWQKFARHAAERGWQLDVIMRDEASIESPDAERLADLPPGVHRIGVPDRPLWFETLEDGLARAFRKIVPRPQAAESLAATGVRTAGSGRDLLRAYFSYVFHLRQRRWARDAAKAALDIADRDVHKAVIGCGPPYSACIAGRHVTRATGIPLIIDLRDPWSIIQRMPESLASPVMLRINAREERLTVAESALVVANSAPVGEAMRNLYPRSRILDVPNGYDEDPLPPPAPRDRFVIAYAGTIYFNRDPRSLFRALARVVDELRLPPERIGIDLMGLVDQADGVPLETIAAECGVGDYVRVLSTRPRSEAIRFLSGASMLVVLPQDADMVIPGKLYEYMRFEAWILALAEHDGAVARLLAGSAAQVISSSDIAGVATAIKRRYEQFERGERGTPLAIDQRFSRRARAAAFFGALDSVVGPPPYRVAKPPLAREPHREWDDAIALEPAAAERQ